MKFISRVDQNSVVLVDQIFSSSPSSVGQCKRQIRSFIKKAQFLKASPSALDLFPRQPSVYRRSTIWHEIHSVRKPYFQETPLRPRKTSLNYR